MLRPVIRRLRRAFASAAARARPERRKASCFADMAPLDPATYDWILSITAISMLHVETLMALYHLAQVSRGTILEVGPYVGGSTVVMAKGLQVANATRPPGDPPRRVITIEVGGAYTTHPSCPSRDILGDLHANLRRHGVQGEVEVVRGSSSEPHVRRAVERAAREQPIGLMVLDADGLIQDDLEHFWPYCHPSCYLVCDDYLERTTTYKCVHVMPCVNRLVREGHLEPIGILPWGTWFGRMRQAPKPGQEPCGT